MPLPTPSFSREPAGSNDPQRDAVQDDALSLPPLGSDGARGGSHRVSRPEVAEDDAFSPLDDAFSPGFASSYGDEEDETSFVYEREEVTPSSQPRVDLREESPLQDPPQDDPEDEPEVDEEALPLQRVKPSREKPSPRSEKVVKGNPRGKKPAPKQPAPQRKKPTRPGGDPSRPLNVDEEKLKLKPFGRAKELSKDRYENDFDKRANLRRRADTVRTVVLGLATVMAFLTVKTAVIPPDIPTEEEIATIARQQAGDTGYPLERGRGFAQNFMKAYLDVNSDPYAGRALSFFYSGTFDGSEKDVNQRASTEFKQVVVYGPTVYNSRALSASSATYTIGALVDAKPDAKVGAVGAAKEAEVNDGTTAKWSFFSVSVYYDKKTDSFRVAPESPVAIPSMDTAPSTSLPKTLPIGTGQSDSELTQAVTPTVDGYIRAFAVSSPTDHAALDQYITNPANVALTKGMANRYTIESDDKQAITFEAYPSADPNKVQVAAKVTWTDKPVEESEAVNRITSSYIITLDKQTNGKYLVSAISPHFFIPDPSTETAQETEGQAAAQ